MKARIWAVGAALVTVVSLASCLNSPTGPDWSDPTKIDYYSALHVNLARMQTTASGAFYWDSIAGTGTQPVHAGDTLTVKYSLWLPNGNLIGQPQNPLTVVLDSTMIRGWVEGLQGAVQGTLRQLVVPPALAYGAYGSQDGTIPPNTTLVFLVNVLKVSPLGSSSTSVVAAESRRR